MDSNYINFKELNQILDPIVVLNLIGYEKSDPIQSGQEIRDFCPIHKGDKQRSLCINTITKVFHCKACPAKGDLIGLYAKYFNISNEKAANKLNQSFQINIKNISNNTKKLTPNFIPQKSYKEEDVITCWNNAKKSDKDTYFKYKKLSVPFIARFGKNPKGFYATMVQLTDINGTFRGFISLNTKNKFNYLANETKDTPWFAILGDLNNQTHFFIGEGIATVQTPWEAVSRVIPAVSAGTWSNILSVVTVIKQKYPQIIPIVLIDLDDQDNGSKAANQVKEKFPEAFLTAPNFEGLPRASEAKDFNDLISICNQNLITVKKQLKENYATK